MNSLKKVTTLSIMSKNIYVYKIEDVEKAIMELEKHFEFLLNNSKTCSERLIIHNIRNKFRNEFSNK